MIFDSDMGLAAVFDFVLTSYECKSEKTNSDMFNLALEKAKCTNPKAAVHVGEGVTDVIGATSAGWKTMLLNEKFEDQFEDWFKVYTRATSREGALRARAQLQWGRRDTVKNLDWIELWAMDHLLYFYGFPQDDEKRLRTTYIRGVRDD